MEVAFSNPRQVLLVTSGKNYMSQAIYLLPALWQGSFGASPGKNQGIIIKAPHRLLMASIA